MQNGAQKYNGERSSLSGWFGTPQGAYVLGWELVQFDSAVDDVFGFRAVQVGLPEVDFLRQNRIPGVEGSIFASPVAADGKLFILNESGKLAVLQSGRDWHVLAVNDLADNCYATPAIADGVIVVRSERDLWAFQNN